MRKFLSLVLALAMAMSLVVVNTSAKEFTDDDELNYDEAVAVISEIGVVDGYPDGSFKPQNGLTRGAAAKIICNLILGPTTAAELHADTRPYPDVAIDSEFAGYIAYCAQQGIISGYADGEFKAGNPLTGYAFMKMLLGALGYDSNYEGYVGENWSIQVAKQALGIGLNKGLVDEFNGVDYVTREEAALYAFNTLQSTMVDYENKITATVNGADVTISNTTAHPVNWSEGINEDGNIKDDGFVQFAEEYFPKLVRKDDSTKFMEPANTWVYDKTDIGTYERTDLLVESYTTEVTGKDAYDLLGSGVIKDNDLESYLDGDDNTITTANLVRSNDSNLAGTGDGVVTKIYLDTDKDLITIVSINTWLAQATADYSESKEYAPLKVFTGIDQTASYNVDVEDVANVVDVTNETFYQVTISYKDSTRGEIVTVAPAEVLEDSTVTKYSASDRGDGTGTVTKLTTGGEEYERNVKAYYDEDILNEYDENLLTDATYNVYLDSNGYFIGVSLFDGVKNYVFITGYDRPTSNLSVKTADAAGIFLDGTMKQIKVNVKATNENIADAQTLTYGTPAYFDEWTDNNNGGEYALNRWYTYTVDADGVYTLKPAVRMTATNYTADTTINTANLRVSDNVKYVRGNVYGEDATVFLTVDLDEVDTTLNLATTKRAITDVTGVYTGVQEVEIEIDPGTAIEEAEVYTVYDSDYFIIGAIVVGEGKGNAANIAYLIDGAKSEEKIDDTYYWEFDCIMDGQVQTLTAKSKYLDTIRALRNDTDGIVELRFDGDYVVNVKDVDDIYGNAQYTDPAEETSDYDVYDVTRANELHLQGRTLYVMANQADMGLALKSDAKAVTIQTENTKTNVKTEFTSVSSAISHLADANPNVSGLQYDGRIIAALDSTGAAAWVVFISDTALTTGAQGGGNIGNVNVPGVTMTAPGEFEVTYYDAGNKMTVQQINDYVIAKMEAYMGASVRSYIGTSMTFDDGSLFGTTVKVTTQQQNALKVNGTIVGYYDVNDAVETAEIDALNLADGTYIVGTVAQYAKFIVVDGKDTKKTENLPNNVAGTDMELVTAYKVNGVDGNVSAALDNTAKTNVPDGYYVAAGQTVVVTFKQDTGDYTLNGQLVRTTGAAADVTVKVSVNDTVTVETVAKYMSSADLQAQLEIYYKVGTPVNGTGITITPKAGNVLDVVITNASFSGSRFFESGAAVLNSGNTIKLTFADGQNVTLTADKVDGYNMNGTTGAATNGEAEPQEVVGFLAAYMATMDKLDNPTTVTSVVTNTASGQSITVTMNITTNIA